jgi:hypothetical protein
MKIRFFRLSALLLFLFIVKIIVSCTPESCIGETISFANITFYKKATNRLTSPDSITVFGIGRDSAKLYSSAKNLSIINLPLDASRDTCEFIMKIDLMTDTLKFIYSSYPHLISKVCGITFYHSLNSLITSRNAIDTIFIENKNITTFSNENIRIIYY